MQRITTAALSLALAALVSANATAQQAPAAPRPPRPRRTAVPPSRCSTSTSA
jgi:hypothetical protein